MNCFVAGIVKGLVEHDDATRHFGSLGAFSYHKQCAIDCGMIDVIGQLTGRGRQWYVEQKLADLKERRAYYWQRDFRVY